MTGEIIVPGADWRPYTGKSTTALTADIFCAHTEVWSNEAAIEYGGRDGNPYAHLYLAGNGYLAQVKDLRYRAAANLEGNWHVIALESADLNEGIWPTSYAPRPWTDAQLKTLIATAAWCCKRFNIPPVLIPDTKPERRGLAYHRLGIVGWGWVDGAELWSKANGKVCPDDPRVSQFINIVVPAVKALVEGDWLDMATLDEVRSIVRSENRRQSQFMLTNQQNQAFTPTEVAWLGDAVTNVDLKNQASAVADLIRAVTVLVEAIPAKDEFLRVDDGETTVRQALLSLARRGANAAAALDNEQALKVRLDEMVAKLDALLAK